MLGRQLVHKQLKAGASPRTTRRLQQILHQLEYRHDVPPLLRVFLIRRQKLRKQQDRGRQQALRRIVEEGVLPVVRVSLWADDGLGEDLGVLFGFGAGSEVVRLFSGDVHIAVDEHQQIVAVRAGRITQIDDGDMLIAVILFGNRAVVAGEITFGIQRQKAHAGRAGIFKVGIEEECRLARAGGGDHQAMDVIAVHQRSQFIFLALAAQHQSLLCGKAYSLAPVSDLERHVGIGLADLLVGRPTRRAVLSVTHGAGLDAAECIVVGQHGESPNDSEHPQPCRDQYPDVGAFDRVPHCQQKVWHSSLLSILFSCSALRSSFQSFCCGTSRSAEIPRSSSSFAIRSLAA